MDHPHISVLIDYLRNLLPANEKERSEAHVQQCSECRALLERFTSLQQFARDEVRFTPPTGLVESVRQTYGGTLPANHLPSVPMRLVFDSFAAAAVAGLRRADQAERQLTFESGTWRVELAVDKPYGLAGITVVGQLTGAEADGPAEARIRARQGKRIVAQTASNDRGEFSLSFVARASAALEIKTPGEGPLLSIPAKYFLE